MAHDARNKERHAEITGRQSQPPRKAAEIGGALRNIAGRVPPARPCVTITTRDKSCGGPRTEIPRTSEERSYTRRDSILPMENNSVHFAH